MDKQSLITHWNVRGIQNKLHELQTYITDRNPLVMCLQETLHDKSPFLSGYSIFERLSDKHYNRGMITAIKPNIGCIENEFIDMGIPRSHILDVTVSLGPNLSIRVINVYRSHHQSTKINFRPLVNSKIPILICGDFNARNILWDPKTTNDEGRYLLDHIEDLGFLHILNDQTATFRTGSALDLSLISNTMAPLCSWQVSNELYSDHHAIEITYSKGANELVSPNSGWLIKKIDWESFRQAIVEGLDNTPPADSALSEAENLDVILNNALEVSCRRVTGRKKRVYRPEWQFRADYKTAKSELNHLIKRLIKIKKASPHTPSQTQILTELEENIRTAQATLRKVALQCKKETWVDWCSTLSVHTNISAMWKKIKSIEGTTKHSPPHPNRKQESNRLAEVYSGRSKDSQLPPEVRHRQNNLKRKRKKELKKHISLKDPDTDRPFVFCELIAALKDKKNTAPGQDGFMYSMLKQTGPGFKSRLLNLFNMSWQEGKLPPFWKNAIIHCIPKPSDPANPRPISLLSVIDKLMESMVLPRLKWKLGLPHDNLRGFINGRSTQDCITALLATISEKTKSKERSKDKPIVIFLDLEKAFELASRLAITEILIKKGVRGQMLSWLSDYLDSRQACVRFQGVLSDLHTFDNGTPQGSVLSPTLFNLLMEDIVSQQYSTKTKVLSYADDLVLVSTRPWQSEVETDLETLEDRCEYLGLKISAEKTKAIAIRQQVISPFRLSIQGRSIEWVKKYKYLGIYIDKQLSFHNHLSYLKERIAPRLNIMRRMCCFKSGASFQILKLYYTSAIRSIVEYSFAAIMLMSKTSRKQLDVIQNKAMRVMTRSPPWTSKAPLEYATNLVPLAVRENKAILRIIDCTLRDKSHPNHESLHAVIVQNKRTINPLSWNNRARALWVQSKLVAPPPSLTKYRKPWELEKVRFVTSLPTEGKQNTDINVLKNHALMLISMLHEPGDIKIFTDGSLINNTAGCGVFVQRPSGNLELSYRINDGASSLQSELLAILAALNAVQNDAANTGILLMTDSLAAIQTLQHRLVRDNESIIHSIKDRLANCMKITIVWVPSHVGVYGNEKADKLANKGARKMHIDSMLPSISRSRHLNEIKNVCSILTTNYFHAQADGDRRFECLAERTGLVAPKLIPQNPKDAMFLFYFILSYKLPQEMDFVPLSNVCKSCKVAPYSLLHHFFECPEHKEATDDLNLSETDPISQYKELTSICLNNPNIITNFCQKHPPPR